MVWTQTSEELLPFLLLGFGHFNGRDCLQTSKCSTKTTSPDNIFAGAAADFDTFTAHGIFDSFNLTSRTFQCWMLAKSYANPTRFKGFSLQTSGRGEMKLTNMTPLQVTGYQRTTSFQRPLSTTTSQIELLHSMRRPCLKQTGRRTSVEQGGVDLWDMVLHVGLSCGRSKFVSCDRTAISVCLLSIYRNLSSNRNMVS